MKLYPLTSLRFFAALAVLFEHFFQLIGASTDGSVQFVSRVSSQGYIWVGFFFVLSGFIISYSFENSRDKSHNKWFPYLYRRFARLYPVHLITLLFFCYHFLGGAQYVNVGGFIVNALMLQSWVPSPTSYWGFNSVSWSISCEMFFYVAFIFLITLSARQLYVLFGVLVVALLAHYILVDQKNPIASWMFYINPAFRLVDFMAGMIVFNLFKRYEKSLEFSFGVATVFEVCSIAVVTLFLYFSFAYQVDPLLKYGIYYVLPMSIIVFVFALGRGFFSGVLTFKPLVYLGEASFCLYMTHLMINGEMYNYFRSKVDVNSFGDVLLYLALVAVVCVVFASILYSFYEKPMNNILRRAVMKKIVKAPVGTPA